MPEEPAAAGGFSNWLYSPTEYPKGFPVTHPETLIKGAEATLKGIIRAPEFLQPVVEAQLKGPLATAEAAGETAYGLARYPFDAARRLINAFGAGIEEPPHIGQERQPAPTSKEILDMYAQNPVLLAFDLASVFGSGSATMKAGANPRLTMSKSQYRANLPEFERTVAEVREQGESAKAPGLEQVPKPKEPKMEIPVTQDVTLRQIKESPTASLMDELLEMQRFSKEPLTAEQIAGMSRQELEYRVSGGRIKPGKETAPSAVADKAAAEPTIKKVPAATYREVAPEEVLPPGAQVKMDLATGKNYVRVEAERASPQETAKMPEKIVIGGSMPGLKEAVEGKKATKPPEAGGKLTGEGLEAFKGPAQIAKETMPKEGEPVGVQHIREFFSRSLRVPIFTGFKGKRERILKATGAYNKRAETIAMKDWGDVAALTHEVAHHIDKGYKFSDLPGYKEELGKLDYEPTKSRPNEGFAEYVRHYLTESAKPEIMAPKFTESFTQFLAQHPELKETLESGKGIISRWRNEGSEARVIAHIDWKGRGIAQTAKEKVLSGIARVRTLFEDDWLPVETLEKKATGEGNITEAAKEGRILPADSPTLQYRANKMAADRKAMDMVTEGTFDMAGNKTGPSLREALAPISNQKKQFALYGTARRALELHKRGINPGIDLADATFIRDKYESRLFRKAFEDYQAFNDRVWDYVVESGAIERQAVDAMKALNNEYFPFYRVMDSRADLASLSTSTRWANLPSPVKKIRGSGRQIINPYHSMVKNVSFLIGLADKARVGRALAKLADSHEGLGAFIREVELPKATTKFNLEQLEGQLKEAGVDVSRASLDQIVTVYTNAATRAINRDNIITLVVDGKKKAYQVHADIYKTLMSMDRMHQPFFIKYFFAPVARAVRLGATGLRPGFSLITNPLRDIQGAWLQSEFIRPDRFPDAMAKATIDRFNPSSETKELYARSGVDMAHFIGADRKSLEKAARQVLASDAKKKTMNVVSHPIEALKEVLSVTESIPRLAEFEAAYKKGEQLYGKKSESAQILASAAARDVTVNFTRMGAYGSVINQIIPFWNANVQGLAKFIRFAREHPIKASTKAVASLTIPTAILWNIHKDEQWYKELPAWEKYSFWHFNLGKNPDGSDKILRLPKPFEWTVAYAGGPELALNYFYSKDPEALKEGMRAIVDQITPGQTFEINGVPFPAPVDLPPSIKVPIELWANYDFFRDRPIDPYWEAKSKDPKDRFSPYTTETAKFIGKTFGLSPRKIDHLLQGMTGGLASGIVRTVETGVKAAASGEIPEIAHPANIPVVGRLFTRTETPEAREKRIQFEQKELIQRLARLREKGKDAEADKLIEEWNNRYPDFRY
ncbi:MAG: LPD38 domain-containing protein [Candidatus Zixiibacteriota bacterium]